MPRYTYFPNEIPAPKKIEFHKVKDYFQCPDCGAMINGETLVCRACGKQFTEHEIRTRCGI
jgi:rubredoxin